MKPPIHLSRRAFTEACAAALLVPGLAAGQAESSAERLKKLLRIRTITAGFVPGPGMRLDGIDAVFEFLLDARERFEGLGYTVQTLRIATPPLGRYLPDWSDRRALDALTALDRLAVENGVVCSIGPVIDADTYDAGLASWTTRLLRSTQSLSLSVNIASSAQGIHRDAVRTAAETIVAASTVTPGGEGNFRFAAGAYIPPGTPFFPTGYFDKGQAFSIGLESPRLLQDALSGTDTAEAASLALSRHLHDALGPIERAAQNIAAQQGLDYLGIDVSPAPGLDSSIGAVIETLSGVPFGDAGTLAACAAITDVLRKLQVKKCGYSGLMLPVLEDRVLARRSGEGRFRVSELLLYSSVCGTGLDVVPLPGATSAADIARSIGDVAALAHRYAKPLSARFLPIPGKKAGELARFNDPYLVDALVMPLD